MKKILFFTDTPQIGGAELQIFLLAKFLNKAEFTPIIVCTARPSLDKWCRNFEKEEIKVIRLPLKHKHNPKQVSELKKIIKQEEVDLMHIHVWNPASCRYAFIAGNTTNTPMITTEHDPFKISWIKDLFKKNALNNVKKIITVSANNKKILSNLYPNQSNKIHVIHNGIDTTWWNSQLLRFTDLDRKQIKKNIFHANQDSLIITCIAELHQRKGQDILINAIKPITKKYPNIKLILIGEGPAEQNYKKLVKKLKLEPHITFTGRQKNIPHLLKSSDIFVLPSRREAFGLVNLEAMITTLPIVATNAGGIPEVIQNNKTGTIVPTENSHALTTALLHLIENPNLRDQYSQAGHTRILQNFSAKTMAHNYEKIYTQLT